MSSLVDLLRKLGQDPTLAQEFEKDPDAVMSRFELNEEERKALQSGDLETIKRVSGLSELHTTNKTVTAYD